VVQLHRAIDRIHAAGAELVVIGNGAPNFLDGFRKETGYEGPLFTDPSLEVYRVAEMRRGLGTVLRPSMLANARRASKAGFKQGGTQGDAMQQGGVLIVDPAGRLRWRYASKVAGDHPSVETVLSHLGAPGA
jgi:hypothetical protein